jgi:Leucine-rich repeat (LRR) protein
MAAMLSLTASADETAHSATARAIEALGGHIDRSPAGAIVGVSLARTWASDDDIERLTQIKTIKRLDLSFSYVTDAGVQHLQDLPELEDLTLDTVEALTDAAASYLRADKKLRRLVLRGTDITDVGMPYLAALTGLKSLDLSHTMIGDVGLESLPALSELEELNLGGTRITGANLNFLKLLRKLRRLSFSGIQRRNAGACWTPLLTDLDMDTISSLSGMEDLNLGVGVSLGRTGVAVGSGNCQVTGGIQLTDLGLAKLARLTHLRRLDISGAKITSSGLQSLAKLPQLERLSLWNCVQIDDSAATQLAAFTSLKALDLSATPVGDPGLDRLTALPKLELLYLTDTRISPQGLEAFHNRRKTTFVSWARRPEPTPGTTPLPSKKKNSAKAAVEPQP